MNAVSTDSYLRLATEMADRAGAIAMRYFRDGVESVQKSDNSPVTVADREIEQVLREMITDQFPDHGILGEEFGNINLDARYVWTLDPIDGTHCFAAGYPLFGILIALLEGGKPVLGIIDAPAMEKRWIGIAGQPTTLNGEPVQTRSCASLDEAWITSSSPFMFTEGDQRQRYNSLQTSSSRRPVFSGNCVAYGLLSSGKLDIVCEADLGVHDYMALIPVIEGSGGIITDWQGGPLTMQSEGEVLACGDKTLHSMALEHLSGQTT